MKKIIVTFISVYQSFFSPLLKQLLGSSAFCRFSPSCSQYAKIMIQKHGVIKGTALSSKRILSCQPFTNSKFKVQNAKLQFKSQSFKQ